MAYNYGFPAAYQPMYQQYPQYQQPNNNGMIWVQGEAGMKAYLVAPNNSVALWDSEAPVLYLKSADATGMPSVKTLDYTIRGDPGPSVSASSSESRNTDYATKSEIEALKEQITGLEAQIKELKGA